MTAQWLDVPISELFYFDPRPVFVVDVSLDPPTVVFLNPAAQTFSVSEKKVIWPDLRHGAVDFKDWMLSGPQSTPYNYWYRGEWAAVVLRSRWKVVTGDLNSMRVHTLPPPSQELLNHTAHILQIRRNHDWTSTPPPARLAPFTQSLRDFDWAKTPLGPTEGWTSQLRLIANLILVDPNPAMILWGPQMVGIYNEHFLPLVLVNGKHPESLGQSYWNTCKEMHDNSAFIQVLDETWDRGRSQGQATVLLNQTRFLLINGMLQERIFDLKLLPVFDSSGETIAFYKSLNEITAQVLRERRDSCVRQFCELNTQFTKVEELYSKIMHILNDMIEDIPFAIAWSLEPNIEDGLSVAQFLKERKHKNQRFLKYRASLGAPLDPNGCPVAHSLLLNDPSFVTVLDSACRNYQTIQFPLNKDSKLAQALTLGERGFGDVPSLAILSPIALHNRTAGSVFMLGTNPRCPYNDEYQEFIQTIVCAIFSALSTIDTKNVSERTQEAIEQEQRAKLMVEASTVGSYLIRINGEMVYANRAWFEISGHEGALSGPLSWMNSVHEDDQAKVENEWHKLSVLRQSTSFELRMKKKWQHTDPTTGEYQTGPTYCLASATIRLFGDEEYITGAITDISQQKWAEEAQIQQKEDAILLKRAQENFIDMTSHEMRNPLSVIFQCAETIVSSLTLSDSLHCVKEKPLLLNPKLNESIKEALEAARTINVCAQHQKRIVDDVLVLSKFEARLIEVCPVDVQPKALLEDVKQMFAAEATADAINIIVQINPSYAELQVDWVKLDPGRLLQVMINFCSNAVKFTRSMPKRREIKMGLGAAREAPSHSTHGVRYLKLPKELKKGVEDHTSDPSWGEGEILYLRIEVIDSGKGMTTEEMERLFKRFTQTSPRTHTKYGGTGLGLFIARLLIGLQGGEVGASSTPDVGSIFAFYVKCRRSHGPNGTESETPSGTEVAASRPLSPSTVTPQSCSKFSLLVVEDNLVNQKILSRHLRKIGFSVHVANHGREAVEFVLHLMAAQRLQELSVILMDVEMPVMGGIEATQKIRLLENEMQSPSPIPILGITANARTEQLSAVIKAGMDDVVTKPFRVIDLLVKLETFLGPLEPQAE